MSDLLLPVSEHLLSPGGLSVDDLPGILGELSGPGIDAADLYFQGQISESWTLEDGIVKEGSFHLDQGVGVRAQSGEKTGLAYSNAISAFHRPCRPAGPRASLCRRAAKASVYP
jgi:TldD protein